MTDYTTLLAHRHECFVQALEVNVEPRIANHRNLVQQAILRLGKPQASTAPGSRWARWWRTRSAVWAAKACSTIENESIG